MKEDNNIKKPGFFDNKDWYKDKIVIGIAVLIFVILFYFFFDFMRTSYLKKKEPEMLTNTLNDSLVVDNALDSTELQSTPDTVMQQLSESNDTSNIASPDTNLFKFHTSYDKIDPSEYATKMDENGNTTYDLFDELMLNSEDNSNAQSIDIVKNGSNVLALKTTLKILSISAKNLLLNDNIEDNREIVLALAESDQIALILIVNKNGKILYATDQKLLNKPLIASYPNLDLSQEGVWCMEIEESKICVLPIYHTFGKIGFMVIKTQ
jgi:hypothetical protein